MRITCPSPTAKHGGRFGMAILVDRAFTKNFHAQFSLPHFRRVRRAKCSRRPPELVSVLYHHTMTRLLPLCLLATLVYAPYDVPPQNKRLVLNVNFETAKDYDITSPPTRCAAGTRPRASALTALRPTRR